MRVVLSETRADYNWLLSHVTWVTRSLDISLLSNSLDVLLCKSISSDNKLNAESLSEHVILVRQAATRASAVGWIQSNVLDQVEVSCHSFDSVVATIS